MRLLKDETIAVVIDIQERLFPHIYNNRQLEQNSLTLTKGLQALGIPILITQQYTKGLGDTIESIKKEFDRFEHLEKTAFSCCDDDGFNSALISSGKKNVILFGMETHICVLQTMLDLKEKGYQAVVVEDCVSSRKENDKRIAIERLRQEGAIITSFESLLFELTRYSKEPAFKVISKLVK